MTTTTGNTVARLTAEAVTQEALSYYIAAQDWTIGSLHATDAERQLARYRKAAALDAMDVVDCGRPGCLNAEHHDLS